MGESACLLRSFSHPSDASREAKEGDPIRALTESISFGRFMSESLAWEKWSTFSHNRYLEEVEKFSKPGSVAQKKAYFEAHYKKKAAMKAAALLEEANATTDIVSGSVTTDEIHSNSPMNSELANSPMNSELANANSNVRIDKQQEDVPVPNSVVAYSADANACSPMIEGDHLEIAEVKKIESRIEQNANEKNLSQVKISEQLENAEDRDQIGAAPDQIPDQTMPNKVNCKDAPDQIPDQTMPDKDAADQENLASLSKKRQPTSSSKSSIHSTRASKPSSSSAKRAISVQHTIEKNVAPNSKKSVGESSDKKKLTPKSLHMSINFASRAGDTSKSLLKMSKDCSAPLRTSTRVLKMTKDQSTPLHTPTRASVNGVSKRPSMIPKSEDRRTKTPLSKSVSGGMTVDGKWHSLSLDHSKSSSATRSKPRSPIISSPFSFRSEERATKRKEKLEERNAKEAEKTQLQTRSKFKAEHDLKKLRQSTSLIAKPNEDLCGESQSPSNHMKKFSLTQPRSPKLGRKPPPSMVQSMNCRPPRRPSANTESSKRVIEKNHQSTMRSVTSLPRKKVHENASPNIQR